ncbi:hypothetical protein [Endothiovibrio diazotrophicus]
MTQLLALLGITALCGGWMVFQLWLAKQDPSKKEPFRPGCGACGNGACGKRDS